MNNNVCQFCTTCCFNYWCKWANPGGEMNNAELYSERIRQAEGARPEIRKSDSHEELYSYVSNTGDLVIQYQSKGMQTPQLIEIPLKYAKDLGLFIDFNYNDQIVPEDV